MPIQDHWRNIPMPVFWQSSIARVITHGEELKRYYRSMFAKRIRGTHDVRFGFVESSNCAALWLAAVVAVLICGSPVAQGQQFGQKQTTSSGHLVTVYSISWPTPVSSVSAEVEVCTGPKGPAESFAFPSFFQVQFADGGAIASYGSKKQPTLERTALKAGQCARGWLDFAVTSGQKPTVIRYHEKSADNKVIEWPVK